MTARKRHSAMFEALKTAKKLRDHDEALERVERRLTALEVQWMDTLDRLKQMMGRVLKERQTAQRHREAMGETQEQLSDEDIAGGHSRMNQRQEEINAQIVARRARMRGTQ